MLYVTPTITIRSQDLSASITDVTNRLTITLSLKQPQGSQIIIDDEGLYDANDYRLYDCNDKILTFNY